MFCRARWVWSWLPAAAAFASVAATPADSFAAWLRLRNDLGHAVVVQSSWTANGAVYRGKPHYLHPGETVSEWIGNSHAREVSFRDARSPGKSLLHIEVTLEKGDLSFALGAPAEPRANLPPVQLQTLSAGATTPKQSIEAAPKPTDSLASVADSKPKPTSKPRPAPTAKPAAR